MSQWIQWILIVENFVYFSDFWIHPNLSTCKFLTICVSDVIKFSSSSNFGLTIIRSLRHPSFRFFQLIKQLLSLSHRSFNRFFVQSDHLDCAFDYFIFALHLFNRNLTGLIEIFIKSHFFGCKGLERWEFRAEKLEISIFFEIFCHNFSDLIDCMNVPVVGKFHIFEKDKFFVSE